MQLTGLGFRLADLLVEVDKPALQTVEIIFLHFGEKTKIVNAGGDLERDSQGFAHQPLVRYRIMVGKDLSQLFLSDTIELTHSTAGVTIFTGAAFFRSQKRASYPATCTDHEAQQASGNRNQRSAFSHSVISFFHPSPAARSCSIRCSTSVQNRID